MSEANKTVIPMKPGAAAKPAPLGRGLSALFGDADTGYQPQAAKPGDKTGGKLPVAWLQSGKYQPRRHFDEEALRELSDSIREHGVLQPLVVRPVGHERYEIVAGERRWRAAQIAGVHDVPVIIRELSDSDALEIALIENIQREDLTALEEADGYKRLMDEFNYNPPALAKIVGKSPSHVGNLIRLLTLPDSVKAMIQSGQLGMGQARALINVADPEAMARAVVAENLTVRDVEAWAKSPDRKPVRTKVEKNSRRLDADTMAMQRSLTKSLGMKVKLRENSLGGGMVTIYYNDLDQFELVRKKLCG